MLTVGAYLPETAPHLKLIVHIEVKWTAENLNFWKYIYYNQQIMRFNCVFLCWFKDNPKTI